jgi:hypothetical protein
MNLWLQYRQLTHAVLYEYDFLSLALKEKKNTEMLNVREREEVT